MVLPKEYKPNISEDRLTCMLYCLYQNRWSRTWDNNHYCCKLKVLAAAHGKKRRVMPQNRTTAAIIPKRKFDTSTQEPNKDVGTTTGKVGMPRQEPNKIGYAHDMGISMVGIPTSGHIHWMGVPNVGIPTRWAYPWWAYPPDGHVHVEISMCYLLLAFPTCSPVYGHIYSYMLNAKECMMTPGGCQQGRRKAGASKGCETGPAQIPELQKHTGKKLLPVAMEGEDRCYVKGRRPGASEGCKMGPTQVPELQKQAGKKLLPGAPGTASKHIVAVEGADRFHVQGRRPGASKGCKTGPTQVPESQK
ncbi:hypothetical protein DFH07DRAFT_780812 [Mycena maculata]|uniref:Uncharacterized protein n=1 Tax=Mycena maculata TaxID=230809 RepID=A0AAD7I2P9_9AGAR|nr:hypothetical protein DFH07DRAFT_780812 [Mycena maculata]